MNTLKNNEIKNKRSTDPFDRLIFEKGLRINQIFPDKKLGVIIILLNNSKVLRVNLSDFKSLAKATQNQLNDWELISGGVGVHWNKINEDLSLKGIIKDTALNNVLLQLLGKSTMEIII
jgi:hypothetical protein